MCLVGKELKTPSFYITGGKMIEIGIKDIFIFVSGIIFGYMILFIYEHFPMCE